MLKKLISLLMILAMVLACSAAGADLASAKSTEPAADRGIQFQPAGANPWPADGTSPTTGRDFSSVEMQEMYEDGITGMFVTGKYYPIMVQHSGYGSGVNEGAPFYGSYADIFYEVPKESKGFTRMSMIFNDFVPKYAGASRSIRLIHLWVRQEWNAPFFFAGMQETNPSGSKLVTSVRDQITALHLPSSVESSIPWNEKVMFDALAGTKQWLRWKYRLTPQYVNENNVLWNLAEEYTNLLGERSFEDHNHTFKFGDMPAAGDDANNVYVLWRDDVAAEHDDGGVYYFNSMYQYDEDENVYYRYMIEDLANPENNAHLFVEQCLANENIKSVYDDPIKGGSTMTADLYPGEPITFANVIVQYIDMDWVGKLYGYPHLTGTGNADFFMGGKHYTGVWNRNTLDDRTVFYGADGQEISLQPGRTMIVVMDYASSNRAVKYE